MEVFDKIKEIKPDIPVIMLSGQEKGKLFLNLQEKELMTILLRIIISLITLILQLGNYLADNNRSL